ncbi:MAG: MFS transporter [Sedimentisphaerales bacterium]
MNGMQTQINISDRNKGLKFLCLASMAVGFTLTLQVALNANFVVQEMNLTGFQQGILEMFRESCGIFALGILALLAGFAEPVIGAVMLIFVAIGLSCYCYVHNFFWLIISSLIWSQGLHIWMPLPNSMGLALAEQGKEGKCLGKIQASAAAGSGIGLACGLILDIVGVPIRPLYIVAGSSAILGAIACLYIPRQIHTEKAKLVFRRKYSLYYLLNFLEGWRKQIFLAFAGFLLVKVYGTPLSTMLIMWMFVQAVGWFASPAVGRLIDRIGERSVLTFYYSFMTICFLGYAFIKSKYLLYGVFILDSSFFVFAMALTTYIGKLAPANEKTMTLSMGVAMNHIASVTMPLVGGIAWKYLGYKWTFLIGSVAAATSIFFAARVPKHITKSISAESDFRNVPNIQSPLFGGEPD